MVRDSSAVPLRSALALLFSLAVCFGAAAMGAVFHPGAWYAELAKPPLNPPNWVFPPVWTALYGLMAVAAWLVWRARGLRGGLPALALFALQLVLNAAWSWLFFGLHLIGVALLDLGVLWVALLFTLSAFWRVAVLGGVLLLPYLLWVSFAAYLNLGLWYLNR